MKAQSPRLGFTGKINYESILLLLLVIYTFLVPFELFLDYVYNIKTIFKPYRLLGMFISFTGIFYGLNRYKFIQSTPDVFLVVIHLWGLILTTIVLLWSYSSLYPVYNYMIILISFLVYLVLKRIQLTSRSVYFILNSFLIAMLINGIVMNFTAYYLGLFARQTGFYKNPNYAAFAINASLYYLVHLILKNKINILKPKVILYVALLIHQVFALLSTGSRSGILSCILFVSMYFFILSSWKNKVRLAVVTGLFFVQPFYSPFNSIEVNSENNVGVARLEKLGEEGGDEIRLYIWRSGLTLGVDTFFAGVGIDQYRFKVFCSVYEGLRWLVEWLG